MKELALVAVLLGIALSVASPRTFAASIDAPSAVEAVHTFDHATFKKDTRIEAQHVVLESGGSVRIENGSHVVISTDILEIRGPFLFDGHGDPGNNGATPEKWTSSGPCSVGLFGPGEVAHNDWDHAGGSENDRGGNGGNGGNGATIEIEYREIRVSTGVSGRPADFLTALIDGGAAGVGAPGRELICGCHPAQHKKRGPRGTDGVRGIQGRFELHQRS